MMQVMSAAASSIRSCGRTLPRGHEQPREIAVDRPLWLAEVSTRTQIRVAAVSPLVPVAQRPTAVTAGPDSSR